MRNDDARHDDQTPVDDGWSAGREVVSRRAARRIAVRRPLIGGAGTAMTSVPSADRQS
jgi:hypothetical protein